jgi:hypothetical protein
MALGGMNGGKDGARECNTRAGIYSRLRANHMSMMLVGMVASRQSPSNVLWGDEEEDV